MNGNDRAGVCMSCAIANAINLTTAAIGDTRLIATLDDVVRFYKTQNPNFDWNGGIRTGPGSRADNGMDMQTACETLTKTGFRVGDTTVKAVGFAAVDHDSLEELRAAVSLFGFLLIGVDMTQAQQSNWPRNAWDYVRGLPSIGGHAVLGGGHMDKATDEHRFVCWAARNTMTQAFVDHQLMEAWVVILPWHLGQKRFIEGMDLATFARDYETITDKKFPVDVSPQPQPTPIPATDPDRQLVADQNAWRKAKGL